MAITSSTIRIYSDEDLHTLVRTITTQGNSDAIDVTPLDEGEVYWGTIQVTESGGSTSQESGKYRFFTLPDCDFSFTPFAAGTTIMFGVVCSTNTVRIARSGVYYEDVTQSSRGNYVYSDSFHLDFNGQINGLLPNTIYSVTPIVIDEFGRMWRNTPSAVTVKTSVAVPTISLGSMNVSGNVASGVVNVVSDSPLTNLEIKLQPQGGGNYINATGYSIQSGTQQFYVSGLSNNTTYNVYATATNEGGSATATTTVTTMAVNAYVTLDDCDLDPQHKTDTVYVEVSGNVASGATIDTVGARFFLTDSTSGTMVNDVYGQQGESSITYHANGLPAGTTLYVFGYMDYVVDGTTYTVYSQSQSVTTVPTMQFVTQAVSSDSCSGTFSIGGNVVSNVIVQYKEVSAANWSNATVNGTSYVINGLTASTAYYLVGTVQNSSGSYVTNTISFTTTGSSSTPTVIINTINNITNEGANLSITISE